MHVSRPPSLGQESEKNIQSSLISPLNIVSWGVGVERGERPFLSSFEPHREQRQCSWPRRCSGSVPRGGDFWFLRMGIVALSQQSGCVL